MLPADYGFTLGALALALSGVCNIGAYFAEGLNHVATVYTEGGEKHEED